MGGTGQMASDDGVEGGDLQTLFGTDAQVPGPLTRDLKVGQLDLRIGTRWAQKLKTISRMK